MRKSSRGERWWWFVALCVTLIPTLIVGSLAWADRRASQRIASGVTVGGVAVGGLTEEQAVRRVWAKLGPRAMRTVTVRAAGRTFKLDARGAGIRLRLPQAVTRAFERGREEGMLERGLRQLTGGTVMHHERVRPTVEQRKIRAFVQRIERAVSREPVSARTIISVRRVSVSTSRTGRRLASPARLRQQITRAFVAQTRTRGIAAQTAVLEPQRDEEAARASVATVVTVSRHERRARLFLDGRLAKTYRVAVGDPKYPTPVGQFSVQTMQKNPAWNVPRSEWAGELQGKVVPAGDPRNPLVARWVGFNGSVGFHGTKSVDSLGQAASHGCVRMSRADVIDLYAHMEIGTPVLVGA